MFHSHNHTGFWKALKNQKKTPYRSSLNPQNFADHFMKIILGTESGMLTAEQQKVISVVKEYTDAKVEQPTIVSPMTVSDSLKRGCSPGIDGITSEHLAYGKSYELCQHLSRVYSLILSHCIVPEIFRTGIVIPLLKKPTLIQMTQLIIGPLP